MGIKRTIKSNAAKIRRTAVGAHMEFVVVREISGASNSTIRNYQQSFHYYAEFNGFDIDTPVEHLTRDSVLLWVNDMRLSGKKVTTINHYLRDVRAFLYWCMDSERGFIEPYTISEVKGQESAPKAFDIDDIETLSNKPKQSNSFNDWRTWAIVNWIVGTGNRSNTVCNVQIGDIDFKNSEIYLRETKNKKFAYIPLSPRLATVLKEYMQEFNDYFKAAQATDYLFPNSSGEQLSTNALRHSFSRYCAERGVTQTNLHGLRHSFAENFLRLGGNIFKLQHILGHSTLDMTKKYVRFSIEDLKEDFASVSPLDNLSSGKLSRGSRIKRNKR